MSFILLHELNAPSQLRKGNYLKIT